MKKPSLTIKFMGLCALVQDHRDDTKAREVTVLMPATETLVPGLCKHEPVLLFKQSQLPLPLDRLMPPHQSLADFEANTYGLWNLAGLELSIETAPLMPKSLKLKTDYDRLLDFAALHPNLGAVDSSFLDPAQWNGRIMASLKFDSGTFDALTLDGKDVRGYGLAPIGGSTKEEKRFRQVARYRFSGPGETVTLVGRPVAGGEVQRLRLATGAEVTVTHLCPADKPDARPNVEEDVLAFYELSSVVVPSQDRRVLHRLPVKGPGVEAKPRQDSCPPVRGYLEAA